MSAVRQGGTAHLRVEDAVRDWRRTGRLPGTLPVVGHDVLDQAATDVLGRVAIRAQVFDDASTVLAALRAGPRQVVVLSARAPVREPAALVETLRHDLHCPVLLALGDGDVDRAAAAIVAGAEPALSLPLSPTQLLHALGRVWIDPPRPDVVVRLGSLELDHARVAARVDGRQLKVTVNEFALLWRLARSAGRVVAREDLWSLWPGAKDPDGTLVAAVTRLRAKLLALGVRQTISTLRGIGYRWDFDGAAQGDVSADPALALATTV